TPNFDALAWLQDWFVQHCDGEWEGRRGVSFTTTDGPGWFLSIPLQETPLEGRAFKRIDHNRATDESWWICQVGEGHFLAACGPRDLAAVVGVFRDWAQTQAP
ncbi:MAG: immunity 53 family protein, partial [Phenylobacterium sp.]